MDVHTALAHLELIDHPPEDVLEELLEERCFDLRDYFLRNPVIPELYASRVRRLQRIAEAAEALGFHWAARPPKPLIVLGRTASLAELLKRFEAEQAVLRSRLSASLHPIELADLAEAMVALQLDYEAGFFELTRAFGTTDEAVKAADHLDTGRLLRWIAQNGTPVPSAQSEATASIAAERRRIIDRRERARRQ